MLNWRALLFYLLPPLLVVLVIFSVNFKADLSAFIIAGDNAEEILLASEMQSGALSRRYLLSVGSDHKIKVPKSFIQTLQARLQTIDGVVSVWLPGKQGDVTQTIQALYSQHANALYSLQADQDLPQIFTEQGLAKRAEFLKTALLSPQGSMVKKIALQDPLLLTLNGFKALGGQMRQTLKENAYYQNLILETEMAGLDALQQQRIQTEIKAVFNKLNLAIPQHYQLQMTGVPVFAVATQNLIQGDIIKVSVLSSIALILLFLLIFRSFKVMFQVFSQLALVILTAILMTQLVFGYVHGMTVAIGSTLVGICIDYPIHAVAHAQTVLLEQRAAVIARIWPSMVLGGVTTMIGYIALGISGYPGFQQVAVYAASGIIISLLLTRLVLPGLITSNTSQQLNIPLITSWAAFCQRFRPWLVIVLGLVLIISLFGLKSLHWMKDMQELTPELNHLKLKDKQIRERMTSIEPGRFVLITGETIEAALQKTEQVYPILDQLKQTADLSDYFGLYPWLLSIQQQQLNRAALEFYLTAENLLLWQQALKQQGLSVNRLGHFNYQTLEPITLEKIFETPVKKIIDSRVIIRSQQTMIMIWLAEHQPEAIKAALDKIDNAQYFSQRDMLNNMTQDYTNRAQVLLLAGVALIIMVLISRYKSVLKAILTLLPAVIAALLILGLWSLTGASVSFLHLVGFLLVVAICVDYGIFYQENRGGDITLTYQAMAASMLTSALAFGSLITAESTSLRILASVVAFGVVLGFLFCPLIISADKDRSQFFNK